MRKTILMMLLAIVGDSAAAEWVKVGENEKANLYRDTTTISRDGDFARMWHLFDFKSPQLSNDRTAYRSARLQYEFDCKKKVVRIAIAIGHRESMGNGATAFTRDPSGWRSVKNENDEDWILACTRGKDVGKITAESATANWIKLGRFGTDGTSTTYADPGTITKQGDMVTMWSLSDSDKPVVIKTPLDGLVGGVGPHLSTKMLFEYDCKEGKTRHLSMSLHSGNMGEGKVVFSQPSHFPPGRWVQVTPGSSGVAGTPLLQALWKIACGKQ